MTEYRFSEEFNYMINKYGAEESFDYYVVSCYMPAWEFRFWAGHRGLV